MAFCVVVNGVILGSGGLNKQGTGTVTLIAANTYNGDTTVLEGTLLVNNSSVGRPRASGMFGSATVRNWRETAPSPAPAAGR